MAEKTFKWSFLRLGGQDQLTLQTNGELRHLGELNPKLWGALSCPASGLEFDARALELLDSDHDGRIRVPEVVAATEWLCARLTNPEEIAASPGQLPLASINAESPEGARLLATARTVLDHLGKADSDALTPKDIAGAAARALDSLYNGDGVFPVSDASASLASDDGLPADVRAYIDLAAGVVGSVADANGRPGLDEKLSDAFLDVLRAQLDWQRETALAPRPLGADTPAAWSLLQAVKGKIDDYFLRVQMASFAPQSAPSLNEEERLKAPFEHGLLETDALSGLPLSRIEPDAPLRLDSGLNPAWRDRINAFFTLAAPLLKDVNLLSRADWLELQAVLAPYGAALAARPAVPTEQGHALLDALSAEDMERLLAGDTAARFRSMVRHDLSVPAASADIAEVEKLVLYYCHLHRFLMNFVSFYEFYTLKGNSVFQTGVLYMDGRSCHLCVPVADMAKHSAMAAHSELCLLYCACTRRNADSPVTQNIMAAMTIGNDALLFEGRNGVFVDNAGAVWDATLVKLVRNPISLRQAVWSPYASISRMLGEAIAKFATAKNAGVTDAAAKKIAAAAIPPVPAAPAAPAKAPFDIGRSVGIFAAVGIALGAVGTAVGSVASAMVAMRWWQFPLILLFLFLCISGPSVLLAWLKLRKRTLGPVLEASGWAVNCQVPINLPLGRCLSRSAQLPDNSVRAFSDRLDHKSHIVRNAVVLLLAAALTMGGGLWLSGRLDFLKTPPPAEETVPEKAAPEGTVNEKIAAEKAVPEENGKKEVSK